LSAETDNTAQGALAVGISPTFMYEVMHAALLPYYNLKDQDSRIPIGLVNACDHVRSQWSGPHLIGGVNRMVQGVYFERDPVEVNPTSDAAQLPNSSAIGYPYMMCHMMAWKYAYDGDTDARDIWDLLMSDPNPSITVGQFKTRKLNGQIFAMAFHGAAWRAGAPALGY